MNREKVLSPLASLSYFDKATLVQVVSLSNNSLYAAIKRWLRHGSLVLLKKGFYVTQSYLQAVPDRQAYAEFLANKLREPSYLSLEYVLQKYSLLTESVFAVTSITRKPKREYANSLGTFLYHNIKPALFTGMVCYQKGGVEIYEATKAKALFDFLYLRLLRTSVISLDLLRSFRLNLEDFSKKEQREFQGYCKLTSVEKYQSLPQQLKEAYDF